jgi:hypothetical protein
VSLPVKISPPSDRFAVELRGGFGESRALTAVRVGPTGKVLLGDLDEHAGVTLQKRSTW